MYLVYKHITPSGKIYVGQTNSSIEKRAGNNGVLYKMCPYFYKAIAKYGWDNIEHIVVSAGLTKKEADWLEKYLIAYYNTTDSTYGYNLTFGGDGVEGRIVSEETRAKIKSKSKGKHYSEKTEFKKGHGFSKETLEKISKANKGRKLSEVTKCKMSQSRKGNTYNMRKVAAYKGCEKVGEYKSITEAASALNVSRRTVYNYIKGITGDGSLYKFYYIT